VDVFTWRIDKMNYYIVFSRVEKFVVCQYVDGDLVPFFAD